jgi:hypothetical protein
MDFFVYSRDAPGVEALRADDRLLEQHWSYMDGFADSMIARGPTLDPGRETSTGSLHVLSLPSTEAAREFVAREPNNRAGMYADHAIWRFENLLGRTMWEFTSADEEPRFLVVVQTREEPLPPDGLSQELRERLILYGSLHELDGPRVGVALAAQAPDASALKALLEFENVPIAIHDWEFGGRR